MGKKKGTQQIPHDAFYLPPHPSLSSGKQPASIIDTHTHLLSTFQVYQKTYPDRFQSYHEFVRGFYRPEKQSDSGSAMSNAHSVDVLIDVWCEAPVDPRWEDVANSALNEPTLWGGVEYWFVMGVHPHEARLYTDEVEQEITRAMQHPRCIGWGEIGLDYHYMNSPAEAQKAVFRRQLKQAVSLGKPITVHTREAEEDTEAILKEEVPKNHKIHVHCFTDSPEFALRLLSHFPNLCIGVTGVITYSTNLNTAEVVRRMMATSSGTALTDGSPLRIVLETDAPYMVPSNLYESLALTSGGKNPRLPFSHSGMIPWTAGFVAEVANGVSASSSSSLSSSLSSSSVLASSSSTAAVVAGRTHQQKDVEEGSETTRGVILDANDVLEISRRNARLVYGV